MPRTKKRTPTSVGDRITKSTQTDELESESDLEIARLQEQVKLLQIQIKVLKDHSNDESIQPVWLQNLEPVHTPNRRSLKDARVIAKGCKCKGNCSSSKCGCVKRDSVCMDFCKCNHEKCENKTSNHEERNKENTVDAIHNVVQNRWHSERQESTWSLGVSDLTAMDMMDEIEMDVSFNPMIPKYQLPRTPPKSNKEKTLEENVNLTPLDTPPLKEPKEQSLSAEISSIPVPAEVDWEKHKAELVQCSKCSRKFVPNRIKKHEACCKRV